MYGLWQALIRLPLGIFSDWLGRRKPFIIVGFIFSALGAWLMAISGTLTGIGVGRTITGLAAGTWVPLIIIFNSFFRPADTIRATAILTFVSSIARMTATGLNGTLNNLGGFPLAFLLATGAAILAIVIIIPVRETRLAPRNRSWGEIQKIVSRKDVLIPSLLAAVIQYATWATTFGFVPVLAKEYGANDITISLLMSLNIAVISAGNLLVTSISRRIPSKRLIQSGFLILATGILLFSIIRTLKFLFVGQLLIGLAMGITFPVLMGKSIEFVDETSRTTAMGLHQAVYAIGMFLGPWVSGILANQVGLHIMFIFTAAVSLLLGLYGCQHLPKQIDSLN